MKNKKINENAIKKITPKIVRAARKFTQTINPWSYYKRFIQVRGPGKEYSVGSENAFTKFIRGYNPGLQLEAKESINEQINGIIRKHASSHVNKYLRSDDGKALRQEVKQLIRMKLGKKNL